VSRFSIRAYDPQSDEGPVYDLWPRALGHLWPLSRAAFRHLTVANDAYRPGDHLVAQVGHEVTGFVAAQLWPVPGELAPCGELMTILVHPAHRRQGIGRALLERALAVLERRGVAEVQLGGGGLCYFWPGVPLDLPGAWSFFQACGWTEAERSYDLVLDLRGYATSPGVYERIRLPNVGIATATPEDVPYVLAFEERHFPQWLRFYRRVVDRGGCGDVVLARHLDYGVVGTSCVMHPRAVWQEHDYLWERLLALGWTSPLTLA